MVQTILLTRPSGRADSMTTKLSDLGYDVVSIPCLEIVYVAKKVSKLSEYQIIIFVSVNAVDGFFYGNANQLSSHSIVMAVGEQTAARLNQFGIEQVIYPSSEFEQNSESFVNLPELKNIEACKVLIVRGDYSREFINQALRQKKAIVDEIVVYQTTKPLTLEVDLNNYLTELLDDEIQNLSVLITSVSILENFTFNLEEKLALKMQNCKLIVPSARIASRAEDIGYKNIFNTNTMNEDSIIAMISS